MKKTLTLIFALSPLLGHADTELPQIVVSATGYPISAHEALIPVEVFDRDDIQRNSANDLGELLRLSNGLELGRNGGPGQTTSLFFRGTESDHNLVMINGVAMNSATVASAAIQNVDPQLLQRVEVVKGPQSTLWGSGAIGGVVSVNTLPSFEPGTRYFASGEHGRYETERLSAGFSHADGRTGISLAASHFATDGFEILPGATDDSDHENTSFNAAIRQRYDTLTFAASHWQSRGTTDYQSFTYPAPAFSLVLVPVSQDFLNSVSSLSLEGEIVSGINRELQLSFARDRIDQNDSTDYAYTDRTTLTWRNIAELNENDILNFGAEAAWEEADIESFGSSYDGTTDFQAVYAQYDATRGKHQFLTGARLLNHEDAGRRTTWNLGYGYHLTDGTILKANAATGFRFPTATERFVFSANPGLRPEKSRAIEVGMTHLIGQTQQIDVSLFRTKINDLIVSTGIFPNTTNVNINEARIKGIEVAYRLRQGPWALDTSVIRQDPRDLSNDQKLLRRARLSAKTRLDYTVDRFSVGGELIYSGQRNDIDALDFSDTTTDRYTLVNIRGSYKLDREWTAFAKLENLFNEDYELAARYNSPGRALSVGIRYQSE